MRYSLWFPTHGRLEHSLRGWLARLFAAPAYRLDPERQAVAARSIRELCLDRGWQLIDVDPRELEITAVVECDADAERVLHGFKITASRALAALDGEGPNRKRFSRKAHIRKLADNKEP
jgi:hypothetical protein